MSEPLQGDRLFPHIRVLCLFQTATSLAANEAGGRVSTDGSEHLLHIPNLARLGSCPSFANILQVEGSPCKIAASCLNPLNVILYLISRACKCQSSLQNDVLPLSHFPAQVMILPSMPQPQENIKIALGKIYLHVIELDPTSVYQ